MQWVKNVRENKMSMHEVKVLPWNHYITAKVINDNYYCIMNVCVTVHDMCKAYM